ncbi:MAG: hypothetical protein K2V38_11365 [Gemmataceae bacterium]|nr:hypothetical protein [Gemmataceae bacterium]
MSTLTFQIEEQKAGQLAEAARERGLQVEELLRQITDDFLSRSQPASDDAFKKALADSTRENEELLRRLAK